MTTEKYQNTYGHLIAVNLQLYQFAKLVIKIAIIGAGNVGTTVATRLSIKHNISYIVRDYDKYKELEDEETKVTEELTDEYDLIIMAIPGSIVEQYVDNHYNLLQDLILVDATNNIGTRERGVTYLKSKFPELNLIKAFNTIGYHIMANPKFGTVKADGYIAGLPHEIEVVAQLMDQLGFNPVVVGDISMAEELEALAWLWITQSRKIGREITFKLLKR